MQRLTSLLLLLIVPGLLLAEDKQDDEIELFVGNWKVTKFVHDGDPTTKKDRENFKIEFTEKEMIFRSIEDDEVQEYQFRIDSQASPKTIDLVEGERGEGETFRGIYKIRGETVTVCITNDEDDKRPTKFESKSGSDVVLFELKLVK